MTEPNSKTPKPENKPSKKDMAAYQTRADIEWGKGLIQRIEEEIQALYQKGDEIVAEHWNWVIREASGKNPKDKNRLGLRIRKSTVSFTIEWYFLTWYRDKEGAWKPLSKYIRKGTGHQYPEQKLKAKTKDWEFPLVWETEQKLAEIRKKAKALSKMRRTVRTLVEELEEAVELFDGGI